MGGVQFHSDSIRMDQLSQLGRTLRNDSSQQLRQTQSGGVEVYKSSLFDRIKSGLKSLLGWGGPTPAEKQNLGETMLRSAIARTYDHQIATQVVSELKSDLADGGDFLGKEMIDRAKALARAAHGRQTPKSASPSKTARKTSPKNIAGSMKMGSAPTTGTSSAIQDRRQTVSKRLVDLHDKAADNKQSLDDFFIGMQERREAIQKKQAQRQQKTRVRSASVSVTDAASVRAEIRSHNALQGRLYLERIDKNGFFGTLLKNARNPDIVDLLGDRKGFEAENALNSPPVTRSGADQAIVEAFRNYEPPDDDPTKGMSQLTDVDKDQIAIAALKQYLALPPDPGS